MHPLNQVNPVHDKCFNGKAVYTYFSVKFVDFAWSSEWKPNLSNWYLDFSGKTWYQKVVPPLTNLLKHDLLFRVFVPQNVNNQWIHNHSFGVYFTNHTFTTIWYFNLNLVGIVCFCRSEIVLIQFLSLWLWWLKILTKLLNEFLSLLWNLTRMLPLLGFF